MKHIESVPVVGDLLRSEILSWEAGPSLGAGPLRRFSTNTGTILTATPARGNRWTVRDEETKQKLGLVRVTKVRAEQLWFVFAVDFVEFHNGKPMHLMYMYPKEVSHDRQFVRDAAFDSRDGAVTIGVAMLSIGAHRLGTYPVMCEVTG